MFLKLHFCGIPIFVNMDKVYDFHAEGKGARLHFDTSVAPYGSYGEYNTGKDRNHRHWSKEVDESPDEIFAVLAEAGGRER
jgi:oxalate decarboxylase/phosphoglucose isomerase-like protein (cupin superfamily)